ncbi:AAA family ATPase (plasmid) [Streptomyces sp. BI20]|uniref:AAA family ATPase n=1 Tax=Streptomyces sp. BI20 TaxID=3403460 RepID=UPI003C70956F
MIVWVNGPFGGGKSTLVAELSALWPRALVFDPESVGFVLREIVEVPTGDFQDLAVWRRSVVDLALRLVEEYERPLLVPMTLVRPAYLAEIHGALRAAGHEVRHVFLRVPAEVLRARIDAQSFTPDDPARDARVRAWRKGRIADCEAAVPLLPADTVLWDGQLPPGESARRLLAELGVPGVRP